MDDAIIHQQLDALLHLRRLCQRDLSSGDAAQSLLRESLFFIRNIMTEEVFSRSMRHGDEGEGLLLFANRVAQLRPLLENDWPRDFSFDDLISELFGIANGDAPKILKSAGKQGKFQNAHALLEKKLDAHLWYKVLGKLGLNAPDRQSILIDSYGITYDAFSKWRKEAKEKLTADYVNRYLFTAVEVKLFDAGKHADPVIWAKGEMINAGREYQTEMNRTRG